MKRKLLGWGVFIICTALGFAFGKHRARTKIERARAQAERLEMQEKNLERLKEVKVSTATLDMQDLPSDSRRGTSVPRRLE